MKRSLPPLSAVFCLALLAGCGGETASDNPATSKDTTATSAIEQPSGPPAPEDVTTKDGSVLADFTGDASKGKRVFLQCMSCHAVDSNQNRIGPTLAGILGQEAGAVEDYNYTPANAESGIVWTPEKMFQYLEDPRRVIPGTKMAYSGLRSPQERADVIAYLTNPVD